MIFYVRIKKLKLWTIKVKMISIILSCRILKLKLKFIDLQNYCSFIGHVMSSIPKHCCSYTNPL